MPRVKEGGTGDMTPGGVFGRNVKAARALRNLSQTDLADRMTRLGHSWTDSTVSLVESAKRKVNVEDLLDLAGVLGWAVPDLLVPPPGETLETGHGEAMRLTTRSWLEGAFAWLVEWDT